MRLNQLRRYIFYLCLIAPAICLLYFKGFGKHKIRLKSEDFNTPEVLGRVKILSNMVEENQGLLEKLKSDMFEQRKILLDKIRNEISAESHLREENQQDQNEHAVPHLPQPAIKTTSTTTTTTTTSKMPVQNGATDDKIIIPVVITACNRPSVSRCLEKLISVRGAKVDQFPLIVSQDCGDKATAEVLEGYGDKITFVKHPEEPLPKEAQKAYAGYYKIAIHYKFAIAQAFEKFPEADSIIIVEDDIEVAPDFFSYFLAMHNLLKKDATLWCASAWNDNGKTTQVDATEGGAEILYRTDFFPGLGWMLLRSLWEEELASKWPTGFWDDWMRNPEQRKGRACIRPEISRTSTFGRKGVSAGQFFDQHLKFIKLNEFPIDWSTKDLSYLIKENYDKSFTDKVYSLPLVRISDLKENKDPDSREVRIEYTMLNSFKSFAKDLNLMTDLKKGVPRTAYMGIVSTLFRGRRVYLSPPKGWTGYTESWE